MNFGCIISFIRRLDQEISVCDGTVDCLVYSSPKGARNLTNAAFLLGAYLLLRWDMEPEDVERRFGALDPAQFEEYRDATYSATDFRLRLADCWRGLARARDLGWVDMPSAERPTMWGRVDEAQYSRLDSPLNGDVHVVVPDAFVAFKGPRDLDGRPFADTFRDGRFFCREFSPEFYVGVFHALGVSTVLRLNDACYTRQAFVEGGIEHHDLHFDDCTPPPPSAVARFFDIVDAAAGAVAIHCKAGLGRTGTLVALELIRSHGFTAREAMGWLRIMRPGSVIGRQQQFLCSFEAMLRADSAVVDSDASPVVAAAAAPPATSAACPRLPPLQQQQQADSEGAEPGGRTARVRFDTLTKQCSKDDLRVRKLSAEALLGPAGLTAGAGVRSLTKSMSYAEGMIESVLAASAPKGTPAVGAGSGWALRPHPPGSPLPASPSPRPIKPVLRRSTGRGEGCSPADAEALASQVSEAMVRREAARTIRMQAN